MECTGILYEEASNDLRDYTDILVVTERHRVSMMINELKSTLGQNFRSITFTEKDIVGHYDAIVIDGSIPYISALAIYDAMYPYWKRNVSNFYIVR